MTDTVKENAVHRRAQFLEVLGIRTEWLPRVAIVAAEPAEDVVALADAGETAEAEPAAQRAPAQDAPVGATAEARGAGGRDGAPAVGRAPAPDIVSPLLPQRAAEIATLDWAGLEASVAGCTACGLCETRTQTVFGVGDRAAEWMLVGEAPGQNEDLQGEPFVGQAGKLLDNMLGALNLARGRNVFIANVLKCRPPENRDPAPDEVAQCEPYLRQQIALLRPKVIVVLGRFAAQSLLRTTTPIGKLRGTVHEYEGIPVVVTYHPAYLLRTLSDKARAWEDLCLAREVHDRAGAQA
ncbi:uracil-DNA glycosylase [Cupriavidus pampae]|uniref:Type-4 uracil-DNA glycosylase n=1 Tax=Cupriavidus pampae TaxID=659251 RepID=A0ABN7Z9T4_9BURK|nr:hypothetical protein LMG32289_04722 [Cupriavidus pampae]